MTNKMTKYYVKKKLVPMRPYLVGESMKNITVTMSGKITPKRLLGGMIAHDPNNPDDQWYISEEYFNANYMEHVNA